MKFLILAMLLMSIAACTNDDEGNLESPDEPMIYREYIEEGSDEYLEDQREKEEGKIYYRDYHEDDEDK